VSAPELHGSLLVRVSLVWVWLSRVGDTSPVFNIGVSSLSIIKRVASTVADNWLSKYPLVTSNPKSEGLVLMLSPLLLDVARSVLVRRSDE
jgi:hypothetical protein